MIRIVVAADDPAVLARQRAVLGSAGDLVVVAVARSGVDAVDAARRHRPQVMLLDPRLPDPDPLGVIGRIAAMPDAPALVALAALDAGPDLGRALRSGAIGYVITTAAPEVLFDLVRLAGAGDRPGLGGRVPAGVGPGPW